MLKKADRQHIEDMVKAAEFALRPADLVSLSFKFDQDWTNEVSIFFTGVITDAAGTESRLLGTTTHISESVRRIVEPEEYDLQCYFNWKTESDIVIRKRQEDALSCSLKS